MKYHLTPDKETLKTNIVERTIGRAVSIEPATTPFGPGSQDLLGDVFHSLYNTEFEPLPDEEAPHDRRINHALMKWMKQDAEFMLAREKTTGKLAHSMVASKLLYEYLLTDDAIKRALEAQDEPPDMPQSDSEEGDDDDDDKDSQGMSGGQGGGKSKKNKDKDEKDSESQSKSLEQALKHIEGLKNNVIGSRIMSVGAKKAEEQVDKADQAIRSWGVEPGDVSLSNIDDIMKLVDENNEKMQSIAQLAGRFEGRIASQLEKTRESYIGQIVDTKRTRDFNLIYPTDLCYLLSPDVPASIHARYTLDYLSAGLLGAEVRSEGKEFGSLCVMVDGSGSMNGEMEVHAKAIAIGLAKALNRDTLNNREYVLNTFSSGRSNFFTVRSSEDWKAHFEWATKFQSGGTDYDSAFRKAMLDIKDMPEGTDLVFITDGQCELTSETIIVWKAFKEQHGTRLLYVDVSGWDNEQLRNLSDLYLRVNMQDGQMEVLASDIASKLAENMESSRLKKLDKDSGD